MVRSSRKPTLKTLAEKSPRGMVVTLKLLRLARDRGVAGGMPGAGISRRARSVQKRRFPRGRPRGGDRQGPQSALVAGCESRTSRLRWWRLTSPRSAPTNSCSTKQNRNVRGGIDMATIAFIGLGNMGGPMAANLVKAGHQVIAFDLVEASRQSGEERWGRDRRQRRGRGQGRRCGDHHAAGRQACALGLDRGHSVDDQGRR